MRKLTELVRRFTNWCSTHRVVIVAVMAVLFLCIPLDYTHAKGELFTKFLDNPFDTTIVMLAGVMQLIGGAIGKLSLLLIQMIVIPVLGYNGFYNSHITNLGWSLVRDVVNMFVVVVLMVIAIMTIVGYEKANWTQQLPKLFIAIVLVNFSKLICGFLIDVSQVVMFTFVNAIVSIAAGNFASMFSMNTFGQFGGDFIEKVNASGDGLGAVQFFLAAYLQVLFVMTVLGILVLLAIAFVWRIVMLWVLIIMSPLAFFMIGVKDIFKTADASYQVWWKKFASALTFGPMMAFFLWLALAASSGSNIAQTEDFPMPDSQEDAGIPLEMFSLDNFLGMFIAVAILMAGMQQSMNAAEGVGGLAQKMMDPKLGAGLLKGLARSPFAAAGGFKKERAWVNDKAQKAGAYAPGLGKGIGAGLAKAGTAMSSVKGLGWAGNATAAVGGNMIKGAKATRKDEAKLGGDQFKERTDDQIAALDLSAANGTNAFKSLPTAEKNAYLKGFGSDQKRRDKYKANLVKGGMSEADAQAKHDTLFAESSKFLDTDAGKAIMDDTEKDRFQDAKFANMHLVNTGDAAKDEAERKKIWDTSKKEGRANIDLLDPNSFKHPATAAFYKKTVSRRDDKGKDINVVDDIVSHGKGRTEQRDAIIGTITAEDVNNAATRKQSVGSLVKANAVTRNDADGTGSTRRDAVRTVMQSSAPTDFGATIYGKAASSLLNGEIDDTGNETITDPNSVLGSGFISTMSQADADPQSVEYQRAAALLDADSKSVRHLDSAIGTTANAASSLAASKVNLEAVKKLQRSSGEGGDEGARAAVALKTMEKAVTAEMSRPGADKNRLKTLRRVADELGLGDRYPAPPAGGGGDDGDDGDDGGGGVPPILPVGGGGSSGGGTPPAGGGGAGGGAAPAAGGGTAGSAAGGAGGGVTASAGSAGPIISQIRGAGTTPDNATVPRPVVSVNRGTQSVTPNAASRSARPIRTSAAGTSATPRPSDRYGSAARPNSAAPRPSDTYGSAARPNSAAPRPSNEYRSGPTR